jgi:hypothetical protein
LVLSVFPRGKAVVRLNKTFIALLFLIALSALMFSAWRRLWISAGFVVLASYLGLRMIADIGSWSFSINACLPVLLLSFGCMFAGLWLQSRSGNMLRGVWLLLLLGGLFAGLAILIRLAVAFLIPGLVILLWPESWKISRQNRVIPFIIGVFLAGILPVLIFQQYDTGAWYVPSYPPWATTAPQLNWLSSNAAYYLGNGPGNVGTWGVFLTVVGLVGLIIRRHNYRRKTEFLTLRRLMVAVVLVWGIPTGYFLTHHTTEPYYLIPSTFGTVLLAAFGVFTIELLSSQSDVQRSFTSSQILNWIAVILCFLPGIVTLARGAPTVWRWVTTSYPPRPRAHEMVLPQRLAGNRAWVWADYISGTLWYYADKPAFKIANTDKRTRAMIYRFVFDRGELQYFVQDSPYMTSIMDEIPEMGGKLVLIPGGVDHLPYFLVQWPKEGPIFDRKRDISGSQSN